MFVTLTVSFSRFVEPQRKPDVRSHPSDLAGAENKERHTSDLWPSRENPVCRLTREGLQTSSPESTFVAWTPPRLTVRTWQDTSEVTTPAAADGAQTHKNAWHNSRPTNDVCSCLTVELPGRCNSLSFGTIGVLRKDNLLPGFASSASPRLFSKGSSNTSFNCCFLKIPIHQCYWRWEQKKKRFNCWWSMKLLTENCQL